VARKLRSRALALILTTGAASLAVLASTEAGATPVPFCPSFASQAAAQEYFLGLGGGPRDRIGGLDGDRDGVACEGRPGPYAGFATLGYNVKKKFFYGGVSMPPTLTGEGFSCMEGNRAFPDGPRRLTVFKVEPGADRAMLGPIGAESIPASGRLVWKADRATLPAGRYYAAFEEKVRLSPYGPNECPGFRSHEVGLP